jgi:hypothetical protein
MLRLFNRLCFYITQRCADCNAPIGRDSGPPDGWQLEDGRTVCHSCCRVDFQQQLLAIAAELEGLGPVSEKV